MLSDNDTKLTWLGNLGGSGIISCREGPSRSTRIQIRSLGTNLNVQVIQRHNIDRRPAGLANGPQSTLSLLSEYVPSGPHDLKNFVEDFLISEASIHQDAQESSPGDSDGGVPEGRGQGAAWFGSGQHSDPLSVWYYICTMSQSTSCTTRNQVGREETSSDVPNSGITWRDKLLVRHLSTRR